jgi:predicted membrane channel-forming protein YqfA (hemolysin III family)
MRFWACLDYSGISASIAGGSISVIYLLLHWYLISHDSDGVARLYWISLLIVANLAGIIGPMFPFWNGPKFRTPRACIYLASGAAAFLPALFYYFKYGTQFIPQHGENPAFFYLTLMILQYVVGAFVYATRFPEW